MRTIVILLLFLAACSSDADTQAPENGVSLDAFTSSPACESRTFEGDPFTICVAMPGEHRVELELRGRDGQPLRSMFALQDSLDGDALSVHFAMNAGMFDNDGKPIGLYVEDGQTLVPLNRKEGPGNFHLMPNGVFSVDNRGRFAVTSSEAFDEEVSSPRWATQSGPMLVIAGKLHPEFRDNGDSRLVRNGVGVDAAGKAYFVISEEGVSFGRFARLFRDGLKTPNALYLDGSVSTLWDPGANRQDAFSGLGPIVVVYKG